MALAIGSGAVGGRIPLSQLPMWRSLPPAPSCPPSMYDPDLPIWEEKTSIAVCPMARARPTSRIIGATTSARCLSSAETSTALRIALAQATIPSCHVERKPLPPKLPPSGVSIPFANRSLRCSSTTLVRVIILCQSMRCSMVIDE